jgi:alkanesulfonate monooxygenase
VELAIYATCPQSKDSDRSTYHRAIADVAQWSERAGCTGVLVYTDNGIVDPWLVSQIIIENTERLTPLVAVQPVYMHPYTAAKMVASLAFLHGRRTDLNMLAGGFRNDLIALGDPTPHDERYARTTEYAKIIMGLLSGEAPVTVDGTYYRVTNLRLTPAVDDELLPEVLMSGSSPAGLAAARSVGALPVKYPGPPGEERALVDDEGSTFGVRVGIIARDDPADAWAVAHERFPEDRQGKIMHRLAMRVSDSHWHRQLSARQEGTAVLDAPPVDRDPYWLGPFQNYNTFCPYLVGSYDQVAELLTGYMRVGCRTFILDIPPFEAELGHTMAAFDAARRMVAA